MIIRSLHISALVNGLLIWCKGLYSRAAEILIILCPGTTPYFSALCFLSFIFFHQYAGILKLDNLLIKIQYNRVSSNL